jgi:PAS domain S-box-containing protein
MRMASRLALAVLGPVVVTAAAVGILTRISIKAAAVPAGLARLQVLARELATTLDAYADQAQADIVALQALPELKSVASPATVDHAELDRKRVVNLFLAQLRAKPSYLQLRIIGTAQGGREIIRIDRSGPEGAIRVVDKAGLQSKGNRDYFEQALKTPAGQTYTSPIELNQEHGAVETPHVPVLRVAAPIRSADGTPVGVVVVNLDMRPLLAALRSEEPAGSQVYVARMNGDYLLNPEATREFASDLGRRTDWRHDFPALADLGQRRMSGVGWGRAATVPIAEAGAVVDPAGGPAVVVITTETESALLSTAAAASRSSVLGGAAVALASLLVALLVARSVSRPIFQATEAVERFGQTGVWNPPAKVGRELESLMDAFTRMLDEVADKAAHLETAQDRLKHVLASSEAVLYTADFSEGDFSMVWVSDSVTSVLGYTPAEALEPGWWTRVVHPDDLKNVAAERARLRAGRLQSWEYRLLHKDGTYHWIDSRVRVYEAPETTAELIGAWLDVTDKKSLETQLAQAQKMEAIGRLTGGVAHDFNNLLTVILGNADLASGEFASKDSLPGILDEIRNAGQRGAALTRQLLAFSRQQTLKPQPLDLNELVEGTTKLLRRLIGEDVELRVRLAPDVGVVLADRGQIEQVIMNLAVNARDAMPGGGRLTLETANTELDEAYAERHLPTGPGPYVMLSVSDTGVGMDEPTKARIFEPFFTTKEAGKGTGLGLATVYGIVKQSGGYIWVYSEPGAGTTFKIYFSRIQDPAKQLEDPKPQPEIVGGRETILLVEDDPSVRRLAEMILEPLGYSVLTAADGKQAVRLISEKAAAISLLVTDVVMPGMSGRELAEQFEKACPRGKTLFTSGYTTDSILHNSILTREMPFLQKPFTAAALARKVREVLDSARKHA